MDERQIRWGLSSGIMVLAIAGYFWYGVSVGVATWYLVRNASVVAGRAACETWTV
jgi:hypothetical protein